MPLALLEQKLRTLPEQSFAEVDEFFNYILFKFGSRHSLPKETISAMNEISAMKRNSTLGSSYTDVDSMMSELLS